MKRTLGAPPEHLKYASIDPLTFEFHILSTQKGSTHYGVKVFTDPPGPPFFTQFAVAEAPWKQPVEKMAKNVLKDLRLAAETPDELWQKIESGVRQVYGDPIPKQIAREVRHGFDRMAEWAAKEADLIKQAAESIGL